MIIIAGYLICATVLTFENLKILKARLLFYHFLEKTPNNVGNSALSSHAYILAIPYSLSSDMDLNLITCPFAMHSFEVPGNADCFGRQACRTIVVRTDYCILFTPPFSSMNLSS